MDMVTRWNVGSDSTEPSASQVEPAQAPTRSVVVTAPPSEVTRIRSALDIAMQELDRALQLKRTQRARVAELCRSDALAA